MRLMPSRFRNAVANRDAHITTLRLFVLVLLVACAGLWYGWKSAPQDLTIHIPPDLRGGATQKWSHVPPPTVYTFGFYIWQQINRWPKNGKVDYKKNIQRYSEYLTPSCRHTLMQDYQNRVNRGELAHRVRGLHEIPDQGYSRGDVKVLGNGVWRVRVDAQVKEYLYGRPVRELYIRYFLRVVRRNVDPATNPLGLMLDCFARPAVELDIPDTRQGAA